MPDVKRLGQARQLFEQKAWTDSHRLLDTADRDAPLEPDDLERLATAAYLMGREGESEALWERAHHACLARGNHEGAARSAGWLSFALQQRGALAPASGWSARAERINVLKEWPTVFGPSVPGWGASRVSRRLPSTMPSLLGNGRCAPE
jgi:hypothetical protein